jgi:hypothetical protein
VDAVVAIARLVVADAGGVGGDVVGALPLGALARQVGRRRPEIGQLLGKGVDEERLRGAKAAAKAEEAEGIAGG